MSTVRRRKRGPASLATDAELRVAFRALDDLLEHAHPESRARKDAAIAIWTFRRHCAAVSTTVVEPSGHDWLSVGDKWLSVCKRCGVSRSAAEHFGWACDVPARQKAVLRVLIAGLISDAITDSDKSWAAAEATADSILALVDAANRQAGTHD